MLGKILSLVIACTGAAATPSLAQLSTEPGRTIIVLDASGSMWGQIEGRAKIEIAREVIAQFVRDLPPGTELGLVAYGHRQKGDCADIELVVKPGALDAAAFQKVVDGLMPIGMTPLTDAVVFAAEALAYTEVKATVILVTDGKETCDRDPCEAARALEKAGIDFTAHVIAFDVAMEDLASLECLPKETGGMFLTADDASTLGDALNIAVETAPEEPEELPEPDPATIRAPETVTAGSVFEVTWEGPDDRADFITIVLKGAKEGEWGKYVYTRTGSPAELTAIIEPGAAEIRYIHGRTRKTLGRAEIVIVPAEVALKAPAEAVAGSSVQVGWTGPGNAGDFITIVKKEADDDTWAQFAYAHAVSPVGVIAPLEHGEAEIRYLAGQDRRVLARIPIELTEASVILRAPEKAVAGSTVKVEWTGPDNQGDFITIVPKDTEEKKWAKYTYTRAGSPAEIEAPIEPGAAEIRYIAGQGRETLARTPLEVEAAVVSLEAPGEAIAGEPVEVTWTGPANSGDFITIVPRDLDEKTWGKLAYATAGSPSKIQAPVEAGEGEIRYHAGQNRKILARIPIKILPGE